MRPTFPSCSSCQETYQAQRSLLHSQMLTNVVLPWFHEIVKLMYLHRELVLPDRKAVGVHQSPWRCRPPCGQR